MKPEELTVIINHELFSISTDAVDFSFKAGTKSLEDVSIKVPSGSIYGFLVITVPANDILKAFTWTDQETERYTESIDQEFSQNRIQYQKAGLSHRATLGYRH